MSHFNHLNNTGNINPVKRLKYKKINDNIKKNMPNELSYLLTAGRVIKDSYTNLSTFVDVFSSFSITEEEPEPVRSFVVIGKILNVEAGEIRTEVLIIDPNGTLFNTVSLRGPVAAGDLEIDATFPLMKFNLAGKYLLKIKINDHLIEDRDEFFFEVKTKK